jgi:hypothetical protein
MSVFGLKRVREFRRDAIIWLLLLTHNEHSLKSAIQLLTRVWKSSISTAFRHHQRNIFLSYYTDQKLLALIHTVRMIVWKVFRQQQQQQQQQQGFVMC